MRGDQAWDWTFRGFFLGMGMAWCAALLYALRLLALVIVRLLGGPMD